MSQRDAPIEERKHESWSENLLDLILVGVMLHISFVVSHDYSWSLMLLGSLIFFQIYWVWNSTSMLHSRAGGEHRSFRINTFLQGIIILMILLQFSADMSPLEIWGIAGLIVLLRASMIAQWIIFHLQTSTDGTLRNLPNTFRYFAVMAGVAAGLHLVGAAFQDFFLLIWTLASSIDFLGTEFRDYWMKEERRPITAHLIKRQETIFSLSTGEVILKVILTFPLLSDDLILQMTVVTLSLGAVYIFLWIYDSKVAPYAYLHRPRGQFRWIFFNLVPVMGLLVMSTSLYLVAQDIEAGYTLLSGGILTVLFGLVILQKFGRGEWRRDRALPSGEPRTEETF